MKDFSYEGEKKDPKWSGLSRGNQVELFQEGHKNRLVVLP
jgi:hypothetical protein